jgi:hypothetical protein
MCGNRLIQCGAVVCGIVAALASCREPGLGPHEGPPTGEFVASLISSPSAEAASTTFRVDPARTGSFVIGGLHRIVFPPRSICDPRRSSYGPSEWGKPCTPLARPITITARSWRDPRGHPHIDFSPALRFAPSRAVMLYMADRSAASDRSSRILWCGPNGRCMDEATNDPSALTWHDARGGFVYRRIKHFSGYNVAAGRR